MCALRRIVVVSNSEHAEGWDPTVGEEAYSAVGRRDLSPANQRAVLETSVSILSQCVSPRAGTGQRTGLVVGYVQSGKTLSFTTVAALANDNGFRIIIVIAGMTTDLSKQSHRRLVRDLGVEESPFSRWVDFFEPTLDDVSRIRDVLAEAQDPSVPEPDRRAVLITLKKNHARLRTLLEVIAALGDAARVPALIIDDEADQASLNNMVRRGDLSTTYRRIRELRELLEPHTFLQYTATPQAPLLISLIDVISPDFPIVLNPGPSYTGGREFFADGTPYVADIEADEIPTPDNPLDSPPKSLLRALRLFFVGVASGRVRRDHNPRNRSMMVHPARETVSHVQYHTWVQSVRRRWMDTLALSKDEPDRQMLLEEFRTAHAEVAQTVADLEDFDRIAGVLLTAVRTTDVRLINSLAQAKRDIHWNRNYSWILVGGQVLDRGFTVEGLTVTYMPRGPGVGNADTIQQRARFLGYKGSYLGYCRVFLEPKVANLYRSYVRHEEDVRRRLVEHVAGGRPLSELRRVFLLDHRLRPTRQSVIEIDYARPNFARGWCVPRRPQDAYTDANRRIVEEFVRRYADRFADDAGHVDRQAHQRHLVTEGVPLKVVYDELLTGLQSKDIEDSQIWTSALILVDRYLATHDDARCTVYQMRPDEETKRLVRNGRIVNLFQGAYPVSTRHVYPGDRELRRGPVTVQLHVVKLREGSGENRKTVAENVKFAALWMAGELRQDLVIQPQGGA